MLKLTIKRLVLVPARLHLEKALNGLLDNDLSIAQLAQLAQLTISQGLLAALISMSTGVHHCWVLLTYHLRLQTLRSILPSVRGVRHHIVAQNRC